MNWESGEKMGCAQVETQIERAGDRVRIEEVEERMLFKEV